MDLRQRLRQETRAAHEALDAHVDGFDIATYDGLARFLAMHAAALGALQGTRQPAHETPTFAGLGAMARLDLGILGIDFPATAASRNGPDEAVGVRYVILGSHLGARVLQGRWRKSTDLRVQSAGAFLAAAVATSGWRELCTHLSQIEAQGPDADAVVAQAQGVFTLYMACAVQAKDLISNAHDERFVPSTHRAAG